MNEPDSDIKTDLAPPEKQTLPEQKDDNSNSIDAEFQESNTSFPKTEFFPVSEGKLITLYILSFGLYGVYWFYKNWQLQQPKMDKKIYPTMRAIFSIFFTHSLFNRINESAENIEHKHRFNANVLATFFIAVVIVGNLIDRISISSAGMDSMMGNTTVIISLILFIASAYPLAAVQATVNRINNDMLGYLNHKYSVWNYLLIAFGIIFWLILALGMLTEFMG